MVARVTGRSSTYFSLRRTRVLGTRRRDEWPGRPPGGRRPVRIVDGG